MTRDEFIATIIIMKFKAIHKYRYVNDNNKIMLYSDTAVTTINGVSKYHESYKDAIKRMSS